MKGENLAGHLDSVLQKQADHRMGQQRCLSCSAEGPEVEVCAMNAEIALGQLG